MGKTGPFLLAGVACLVGCADEEDEFARYPRPQSDREVHCVELPHATPDDSFWLAQAATEARKPPSYRAHSVSLGYAGDGYLTGGVTRDTPMNSDPAPPPYPFGPYPYAPQPPYPWHFSPGWRYGR